MEQILFYRKLLIQTVKIHNICEDSHRKTKALIQVLKPGHSSIISSFAVLPDLWLPDVLQCEGICLGGVLPRLKHPLMQKKTVHNSDIHEVVKKVFFLLLQGLVANALEPDECIRQIHSTNALILHLSPHGLSTVEHINTSLYPIDKSAPPDPAHVPPLSLFGQVVGLRLRQANIPLMTTAYSQIENPTSINLTWL